MVEGKRNWRYPVKAVKWAKRGDYEDRVNPGRRQHKKKIQVRNTCMETVSSNYYALQDRWWLKIAYASYFSPGMLHHPISWLLRRRHLKYISLLWSTCMRYGWPQSPRITRTTAKQVLQALQILIDIGESNVEIFWELSTSLEFIGSSQWGGVYDIQDCRRIKCLWTPRKYREVLEPLQIYYWCHHFSAESKWIKLKKAYMKKLLRT